MELGKIWSVESLGSPRAARGLACALAVVFGVALLLSALYGSPAKLPGVALGWPLMLIVERAALATAVLGFLFLIVVNLLRGQLPIEMSTAGLKWEAFVGTDPQAREEIREAVDTTRSAVQELGKLTMDERERTTENDFQILEEVRQRLEAASDALDEAERREAFADALGVLTLNERAALVLYYRKGLAVDEIGDRAEVTRNLGRARWKLSMAGFDPSGGDWPSGWNNRAYSDRGEK